FLTNARHRSSPRGRRSTRTYVRGEHPVGRTTAMLCHLSQGRLVLDSIQPSLGWFCHFLGSQCCGTVEEPLQQSSIAIYPLGHPFCGDRAILDLGEICLRGMA